MYEHKHVERKKNEQTYYNNIHTYAIESFFSCRVCACESKCMYWQRWIMNENEWMNVNGRTNQRIKTNRILKPKLHRDEHIQHEMALNGKIYHIYSFEN